MGARERFEQHGQRIVDTYSALQDQIFEVIINTLKDGDYRHVDKGDVVLWQAEQLQKLGQLNQETMRLMANADGLSKAAIVDLVKFNGLQIQDEVDNEIQSLTNEPAPVSNDVQLLLNGIVSQTWDDLQNNINESLVTRNYGASSVSHVYRQILTESTAATVSGLLTHQDAVEAAVYRAVDRGLPTKLVDKAGRNWSLEGYARAVVNTTVNHAYNAVRLQRMKDFGMHLALMSSHPNSRPACAWIQGHVVNLVPPESPDYNDKYDSIFNHGYGTPAGTQGVNCRHHLFPFVPGVSVNHQPQYAPEEAIKNGKLVQQQRARERAIRAAKHRLRAAEELGDADMVNQTKTLLRARQGKLREFIKDTNAGHKVPILTRDYSREKIVKTNMDADKKAFIKQRLRQRPGKQRQHIYGTKEYNERVSKGNSLPSYFTISAKEIDAIVKTRINFNKLGDRYQFVDANKPIGHYVTDKGRTNVITTRMKVHQSKKGYHAVPAKSREMLKNENHTTN